MESDHYFSATPASPENLRRIRVSLAGRDLEVTTAGGVFSPDHVDSGTAVLLSTTPPPPAGGNFLDLAAQPQLHPEPAHGANVEFVVPSDPLVRDGVGAIRMRVFERGVGETLSCGTGVAAAALAVRHWAGPAAPDHWVVDVPGGTLGVRMPELDGERHVLLSGPATLVYTGDVTLA